MSNHLTLSRLSILDDDDVHVAANEVIEPQVLVRPMGLKVADEDIEMKGDEDANDDKMIFVMESGGENQKQDVSCGFADSQDMFGLLSGAFTGAVTAPAKGKIASSMKMAAADIPSAAASSNVVVTIPKTEEDYEETRPTAIEPVEFGEENLLGLLSGRFELGGDSLSTEPIRIEKVDKEEVVSGAIQLPPPPGVAEKKLTKAEAAKKAAIANFFNPLAKRMKSAPQAEILKKPEVDADDESDYGDADVDDEEDSEDEEEESEASVVPLFLQQSKSIADLIGDDSDSEEPEEDEENRNEEDIQNDETDQDENVEGGKGPLRAIVSWSEPVSAPKDSEAAKGTAKPRNQFIDAEAEVEDDEFMNYGGIEGEGGNEPNEYDKALLNDNNDEDENLEAVMDFYQ